MLDGNVPFLSLNTEREVGKGGREGGREHAGELLNTIVLIYSGSKEVLREKKTIKKIITIFIFAIFLAIM